MEGHGINTATNILFFPSHPGVGGSGGLAAQGDMVCCLTLFGVSRQPNNLCQQLEVCQAKCLQSTKQEEKEGCPGLGGSVNGVEANGCPCHRPRTSALGRLCMYPQASQPDLRLCWKSIEKNGTIKPLLPNKSRFLRHLGTCVPGVNLSGTWRPGWVLGNRRQRVSLSPHWPVAGSFLLPSCLSLALMAPEAPARQGICTGRTSIQTC